VRRVGFGHHMPGDTRAPESFAFPACLTSLMESLGEDVGWETIRAHNREWTQRLVNKEYLVASGMAFGLLWHPENCPSAMDLTQVNPDHNETLRRAFDWAGYDCEVIGKTDENKRALFDRIVQSIDAGKPVLAFGIVGPPECAIVCGYDRPKDTLIGWSHFQSHDPADCEDNGMFAARNWYDNLWKIVLCGGKKARSGDLGDLIRHGVQIMHATEIDGYRAGSAAYDAWIAYVGDAAYDGMPDEELKGKYRLHHMLVGNHAEARCYLGNVLFAWANGDECLIEAAKCFSEIHDTCWKVWGAAGGVGAPEGYRALRTAATRGKLIELIRCIQSLDQKAMGAMERWLLSREK
ncbi:MAG TPA: hypothetical protein PKE04_15025, partial [Clostridia bacterium]|nr:hypothetical protein [Clostridia bacterium]